MSHWSAYNRDLFKIPWSINFHSNGILKSLACWATMSTMWDSASRIMTVINKCSLFTLKTHSEGMDFFSYIYSIYKRSKCMKKVVQKIYSNTLKAFDLEN